VIRAGIDVCFDVRLSGKRGDDRFLRFGRAEFVVRRDV
jgi:hypothetical protein